MKELEQEKRRLLIQIMVIGVAKSIGYFGGIALAVYFAMADRSDLCCEFLLWSITIENIALTRVNRMSNKILDIEDEIGSGTPTASRLKDWQARLKEAIEKREKQP